MRRRNRLVEGYFTVEALGRQTLRGVAAPLQVYRVLRHSGGQSRLDVVGTRDLTPLVGRKQEVGFLLERWHWVKAAQGQVVLLSGEPGIGKSRLVQVLKDQVAGEPHLFYRARIPLADCYWKHAIGVGNGREGRRASRDYTDRGGDSRLSSDRSQAAECGVAWTAC
jgi:hypothetical protein